MPSNSTDPFSANVGGLRNIGRDDRPGSGPEESQNSGAGTHTHRHGYWPRQRSRVLDWLVNETRPERFLDNIFGEFCQKLRQEGVPKLRFDATTLWHFDAAEWVPSTTSKAEMLITSQ